MLNLVVVEGEGAINNIRLRTAREPIVQVQDENHKPVAGAIVTFTMPSRGASGVFANGSQTLTVTTDQQGQAVARGLKPNGVKGQVKIRVNANSRGQTATTTITQTNAVLMAARRLQQADVSERWERSVDYVISGARRMARLVEQLLDLARARQAGGIPIRPTPGTDLGEVVRAAVDELSAAHPRAEIALAIGGEISGAWDPDRLAQVASNLIGNAVVHGTGRVRVSVTRNGAEAILEVQNGGAPISADVVPRIFEAFQRPTGNLSSHGQGLGLGLFIAERIVAAHGGRIGVRSSAQDGTIFAVALPASTAWPAPDLASATGGEAPHLAVG